MTFFAGENGSGKSTLLEGIAVATGFNPEGGTRNYHFSTHDSHSLLHEAMQLVRGYRTIEWGYFLRPGSFYNVATQEEEYAEIGQIPSDDYHKRSHGESFIDLMQNVFQEDSLLILDEPEAALSPQRQLTLLIEIFRCAQSGAQFIIATHSPFLLSCPDADIYSFDGGKLHLCSCEETGSYQVSSLFFRNPSEFIKNLLQ